VYINFDESVAPTQFEHDIAFKKVSGCEGLVLTQDQVKMSARRPGHGFTLAIEVLAYNEV